MKKLVLIVRILVGLLFIFSGLIKANDPLGLAYKMEEYFAVWHMDWASSYSLALSIGMNTLEIIAGVALIIGWAPGFITRLLLALIVFFTYLTGYAVLSGKIKTCGCFGDCIPLEASQSFAKDIILLVLIVLLYWKRKWIKPIFTVRANLFVILFSAGLVFFGQLNVLKQLPYIDCLPYAAGNNLLQKMEAPEGSVPDSVAIYFTYKKGTETVSFDADHFPDDFDEDAYSFVSRDEKVIRKGNATPPIQDFALFSQSGTDTTKAILAEQGNYIFFFAKDFDGTKTEWMEDFKKIFLKANDTKWKIYLVTNQPQLANNFFNINNNYKLPILTCDGTVMKTFLRTKTGIVAMQQANVLLKLPQTRLNDIVAFMNENK